MKDVAFVNYVFAAVSNEVLKEGALMNEWLGRDEVEYLSKLLDVPLSSVRVHRGPRKRLQAPGGNKGCARMTVMLQKGSSSVLVSTECPEQVAARPKRKLTYQWRGFNIVLSAARQGGPAVCTSFFSDQGASVREEGERPVRDASCRGEGVLCSCW